MWFHGQYKAGWCCNKFLRHPDAAWLDGSAKNITSQGGEDGVIAAILTHIGTASKWCFEVGAGDGEKLSNTKALRDHGWSAVLIECNENLFRCLEAFRSSAVHCIRAKIGHRCLDRILSMCGAPPSIDLGVIDIDGQDYWAWDGLTEYRPRIMMVEYNPYSDHDDRSSVPPIDVVGSQATITPIAELGQEKGYELLAITGCNAVFVRNDLWQSS